MARYVEVSERAGNPFGEEVDEAQMTDAVRDRFYIPGYSDLRQQYDEAIQKGETPEPLPYRLQWVRRAKADGSADGVALNEWRGYGYEAISWDDAIASGIRVDETPSSKGAGGEVCNGDLVLMKAPAKAAAARYRKWQKANDLQFEERVRAPLEAAAERYNAKHGHNERTGTVFEFLEEPQGDAGKRAKKKK